ncbi:DNA ligase (ATP) [Maudiozyma exigua]|uniref:DNA ligase n=1 Tax=Maudiozyma exigua TaxID=34358 RepID=A0A9P7B9X9_MAUEX|nr:DNA ligase (ATP) [Kazachstania exigua]
MNFVKDNNVNEPKNIAISPDFLWLCEELFIKIDNIATKTTREPGKPLYLAYYEVINRFVNLWRTTVGNDFYPALRLILPYRDRTLFNIREVTLTKAICLWLRLPRNSPTEKKLLNWKEHASRHQKLTNFCVEEISKRRGEYAATSITKTAQKPHRITIDELNNKLDELSIERSIKDRGYKSLANSEIFQYCLQNMSFIEMKYFFDILLKNRVVGGHEHKILDCWHPDARDYLSVVSDLRIVTQRLWDPKIRLEQDDLSIRIGYTFSPQLAKKVNTSYSTVSRKLSNNFVIEEKMDGERIQLHYMDYGKETKFLSRRGTDFTHLYGENIQYETIAKYLQLDSNVKNCILDGEMVTFDKGRNIILPFGIVKSSAKDVLTKDNISSSGYSPLFVVFDLLYLNDLPLTESPLHQRKEYLSKILTPTPQHVEIINYNRCDNEILIKDSLEKAIASGSEGIVLKAYDSKYSVGSRNDSWIKIKPEYLEQFGENMDLVVMGRDPGKKDSLICGLVISQNNAHNTKDVKNDNNEITNIYSVAEDESKELNCVISFCTIANGISNDEFKEISRRTRGLWNNSDTYPPPQELLQFGSKLPLEWIKPEDSVVLEVKARSLDNASAISRKYKAGCTLFGGYCRQVRYDKDWRTCYTLEMLENDRNMKRHGRHKIEHELVSPKKRKKTRNYGILGSNPNDYGRLQKKSSIFKDLLIYVTTDYINELDGVRTTKEDLIDMVIENGGTITYNVLLKKWDLKKLRIIGSSDTMECLTLSNDGYDIISGKWVLDCVRNKRRLRLEPTHCFRVSNDLLSLAQSRVDNLQDSYTSLVDENVILEQISKYSEIVEVVKEIDHYPAIPSVLFNRRKVYVIADTEYNKIVAESEIQIKLFGGVITNSLEECNLIVVCSNYSVDIMSKVIDIRKIISKRVRISSHIPSIPYIVNNKWIEKSIEQNVQVPEEDFPYIG